MPFGLQNVVQIFQRFTDQVLHGLPFCYAYIDDVLIVSTTPDEHEKHLHLIFNSLKEYGTIIYPTECVLCDFSLHFLGNMFLRKQNESTRFSTASNKTRLVYLA